MDNLQSRILDHVRRDASSKVFIPKDFLDLGSREAVDQALSRLAKAGDVQRLGRGLYYVPRKNARLGVSIAPDTDDIANALGRQTGTRIARPGRPRLTASDFQTQVPAKPVYLTDGRSRNVRVGNIMFVVKHVSPKDLPAGSPVSAAVFQALRYLGKDAVDSQVVARIRRNLSPKHRAMLLKDARYTTDWIGETARRIADAEAEAAANG